MRVMAWSVVMRHTSQSHTTRLAIAKALRPIRSSPRRPRSQLSHRASYCTNVCGLSSAAGSARHAVVCGELRHTRRARASPWALGEAVGLLGPTRADRRGPRVANGSRPNRRPPPDTPRTRAARCQGQGGRRAPPRTRLTSRWPNACVPEGRSLDLARPSECPSKERP